MKQFNYTVKELIDILKDFPPDLPVLTSGYENGFENIFSPTIIKVKHIPENPYYDGEFQESDGEHDSASMFDAVVMKRMDRND